MHDSRPNFVGIIQQVRRRWRMKLAVRGALAVLAAGLLVFLASASALEAARFTAGAILAARIGLALAIAALRGGVLRPAADAAGHATSRSRSTSKSTSRRCRRRSSARSKRPASADGSRTPRTSRALVRKLVENAVEKSQEVEHGRRVEQRPVRRYAGGDRGDRRSRRIALFTFGPGYLRHAASAMFVLSRDVEAPSRTGSR